MHTIDHTQNIIELHNISFSYTDSEPTLTDITFSVHKGDYLGIIGPNGGGKTTLLKIMLGLVKPKSGSIKLFEQDINRFKDWYKIGYVPQKVTNFDASFPVTVEEVVTMGRYAKKGLFRFLSKTDTEKVFAALEAVEMSSFKQKQIGDLSGGQQQRVFIAQALVSDPEVILLDEPTAGVDAKAQEQFYTLLRKLNKELDLTLVLVSHEIDIIAREVTEVACINHVLTCYHTPQELLKNSNLENLYGKDTRYLLHNHEEVPKES